MAYQTRAFGGGPGGGGFGFGFALTPMVKRLLIANGVAFLATLALDPRVVIDLFAFQPGRLFVRPWGVFTYMFVHGSFMHLFVNMLALFFFGPPLESRWGSREFLTYYVVAGLGGVALSFLFVPESVIGASAAVYGIMLAFAMNWPDSPIYIWGVFPVKAKWLVAFFFVVSVFSALGRAGGGVAHFAHLGGLLAGFIYLKTDWRASATRGRLARSARKVRRLAIVPRDEEEEDAEASGREPGSPDSGWRGEDERVLLDAVDRVLDKISEQGMASLTRDEKRLLDEVSRRHRTN
jgi:membrane associated rhomboid family serine protease